MAGFNPKRFFIWLIDGITFMLVCLFLFAALFHTATYINKKSIEKIQPRELSEKLRIEVPQLAEYLENAGKPVAIAFMDFTCHQCQELWPTISRTFEKLKTSYELILVPESADSSTPISKIFIDHNHSLRTILHNPYSPSLVILEPGKSPMMISTIPAIRKWLDSVLRAQKNNQSVTLR